MNNLLELSWGDIFQRIDILEKVVRTYRNYNPLIWGLPRGGTIVAGLLASKFFGWTILVNHPENADVIIDDVYDTGKTFDTKLKQYERPVCYLVHKPMEGIKKWVVFPWEVGEGGEVVSEESKAHELPLAGIKTAHYHYSSDLPCFCKIPSRPRL